MVEREPPRKERAVRASRSSAIQRLAERCDREDRTACGWSERLRAPSPRAQPDVKPVASAATSKLRAKPASTLPMSFGFFELPHEAAKGLRAEPVSYPDRSRKSHRAEASF